MPYKPYPFDANYKYKFLNSAGNWTEVNMAVPISYQELKHARYNDELVPGMYYRIIDYNTTTSQENTRSAGYSFDIIVQALSIDTLSENAKAIGRGTYYLWGKTEHFDDPYDPDDHLYTQGYLLTDTLYTPFNVSKTNPGKIVGYLRTDSDNSIEYATNIQDILIGAEYAEPTFHGAILFEGKELRLKKTLNPNILIHEINNYGDDISGMLDPDEEEWYTYIGTVNVGGNYFSEQDSKLEAWELKYCLDNDTNRFAWADTINGTGVIYYMKDEYGNECPYDFKNIQFKRDLTDGQLDTENGTTTWVYTFNLWHTRSMRCLDASVIGNALKNDEGFVSGVYSNKMGVVNSFFPYYGNGYYKTNFVLPDNVFLTKGENQNYYGCYSNTFGDNCYSNTFGNECYSNVFGNECYSNVFGNSCSSNTLGNECYSNVFGNECYSNIFGNRFSSNTFGDNCYSNIFGSSCCRNTFGDGCYSNIFGNGCTNNIFGNGCTNNTFGNYCTYNTFSKPYTQYVIIENGNNKITLTSSQTPTISNLLRNITIAQGVNNTNTTKTISHNTLNDIFQTIYKPANSVEISI